MDGLIDNIWMLEKYGVQGWDFGQVSVNISSYSQVVFSIFGQTLTEIIQIRVIVERGPRTVGFAAVDQLTTYLLPFSCPVMPPEAEPATMSTGLSLFIYFRKEEQVDNLIFHPGTG